MNQYILILIWVLLLGLFKQQWQYSSFESVEYEYPTASKSYCFLLVFPLILSAAFRTTFGDQGYKIAYRVFSYSFREIVELVQGGAKGPGFYVIQYAGTKILGNNAELFYFVIATFQMYALMRLYRRYSSDVWAAIFIFVATGDYLSWMQNGIRQFIAVTLIILFSDYLFQKKYLQICVVVLIAATIHTSALLFIPIIFIVQGEVFNWKTIAVLIATIAIITMLSRVIPVVDTLLAGTEYSGAITDWQQSQNDGVNVFRVLVYSVPTLFAIMGRKTIKESNDRVINITCNLSIMSTLLYVLGMFTSGIYVGRFPIYCSLYANGILLPWLLQRVFTRDSAKTIYGIMVVLFIAFYYYQTHYIWGII